jgi:hypothetical protein
LAITTPTGGANGIAGRISWLEDGEEWDLWHKGGASSFDRKPIGIVRPETIVKSLPGSHPPFGANCARRRKHRHGRIREGAH